MDTYKRNLWSLFKSIVVAIVTPIFIYLIINAITTNELLIYGIPGLIGIILLLSAIFSENIKFEIVNKHLLYYVRNRLKEDFDLEKCYVRSKVISESSAGLASYEMSLYITRLDETCETYIDCTPIGIKKFNNLYESIIELSLKPDKKLKTKKKEGN